MHVSYIKLFGQFINYITIGIGIGIRVLKVAERILHILYIILSICIFQRWISSCLSKGHLLETDVLWISNPRTPRRWGEQCWYIRLFELGMTSKLD